MTKKILSATLVGVWIVALVMLTSKFVGLVLPTRWGLAACL